MATEIRVPALGESVTEAIVGKWLKAAGDSVRADEPVVELETDKVTVEVNAPASGVLGEIKAAEGATVAVGAVLGAISNGAAAAKPAQMAPISAPQPPAPRQPPLPHTTQRRNAAKPRRAQEARRRGARCRYHRGLWQAGQILKQDVLAPAPAPAKPAEAAPAPQPEQDDRSVDAAPQVPMLGARFRSLLRYKTFACPLLPLTPRAKSACASTKLRQTIAQRLKDAQNTAAILTTFNDVDMSAVMKLRSKFKELFEKRHGVKLGFMGFFVKACLQALKEIPSVNAEIDGDETVYKNYTTSAWRSAPTAVSWFRWCARPTA